jgi:hypothetical protein
MVEDLPEKPCCDCRKTCDDCRERKLESLYSVHFTVCKEPWRCRGHDDPQPPDKLRLCNQVHKVWFDYRSDMELTWGSTGLESSRNETLVNMFRGYCSGFGDPADETFAVFEYEPIRLPFGRAILNVEDEWKTE